MNILSLVMQYFGPVILNKIAGSLGVNSTLAQKAIAAAAPVILAGILNRTTQPGGAKVLSDTIAKQDPGLLGRLGELVGTGKQSGVVEQGSSALGGLLGNSALGSLAGALSKQVGLGVGASNTLLGLMSPAVLGTLGKEQKSAGLDAAGLANLLAGQKKNITDAIPADFAKLLAGTGLLDAVQSPSIDAASKTVASAGSARPAASVTTAAASGPARPPGQGPVTTPVPHHHHFSWGPWLVLIAGAAALWWSVFGERLVQPHPTASIPAVVQPSTTLATTPAVPPVLASTEVGKQLVGLLGEIRASISGVRDGATAQTALPRVQDVAGKLEKLNGQAAQLNPEARRALATVVASQAGPIRASITGVLAIPGVSAVLKPALDQVLGRLEGLAKA